MGMKRLGKSRTENGKFQVLERGNGKSHHKVSAWFGMGMGIRMGGNLL
jgi:hypothetical protein